MRRAVDLPAFLKIAGGWVYGKDFKRIGGIFTGNTGK